MINIRYSEGLSRDALLEDYAVFSSYLSVKMRYNKLISDFAAKVLPFEVTFEI